MLSLLRFTLDLFSPDAPHRAATPARAPRKQSTPTRSRQPHQVPDSAGFTLDLEPDKPLAQEIRAPSAIESIADVAVNAVAPDADQRLQTVQESLLPASVSHPRANREATLGSVQVAYELRRGKRRTIGFSVGHDGLTVSAPKWVPLYEVDKALQEKAGWVVKKLQETRARHLQIEAARIDWKDGAILPFLGESVTLVIDPFHAFNGVGAELKPGLPPGPDTAPTAHTLHVGLPHGAGPQQLQDAVQAWLMRQANRVFTERLDHFAPHLGVQWRKLSLSSAGTRWGSASADGSIRLNWRLIHFRQSVIDYVVVHELSHLRVMDHSPRFWDTVRTVMPDYAELRGELKDDAIPKW
jgi:predicted metal-dependent hydrolase